VWISEQTAIISLYNINWLVFVTEAACVYCAVRTGSLHIFQVTLIRLQYLPCFVVTGDSAMRCHVGAVTSFSAILMGYGETFGVLIAVLRRVQVLWDASVVSDVSNAPCSSQTPQTLTYNTHSYKKAQIFNIRPVCKTGSRSVSQLIHRTIK
jgi:hypothetical protein